MSDRYSQTETIVCHFCGSPEFARLFCSCDRLHRVAGEYWVVRCNQCSLIYLNPRPTPARMQAHYPPHYVINQFRPAAKDAPLRQRLVARQLERIDSLKVRRVLAACPLDSQARVLDVGCNLGSFLAALRDSTGSFRPYSVTISSLFTLFGLGYEPDLEKSAYAATCIRYATWPLFALEGLLGMRGLLTAVATA